MFASMFKTLQNKSEVKAKKDLFAVESETVKITSKDVKNMLTELDEIKDNSDNDDNCSVTKDDVTDAIELLSIVDNRPEHVNDNASIENFDDTKSEVSSIGENQIDIATIEDPDIKKTVNQINSLQCLFTWNVKSKKKKNFILHIRNKYGEYNLNISSSDFTLERFIGNLIVSYELFHNGEPELAQMKILEIGKWLEELDKSTDEFYLSIKIGLQHIMKATFIHMLFATNLTGECKWLLDDIVLISKMDSKSRASLYAIRAAVLIEYGEDTSCLKKACELTLKACVLTKKACDLDPKTSYWFYIRSLALTAHRQFLLSYKSKRKNLKNEINAINQANILFDGINTLFKYHEMVLFKDTIAENYHNNTNKNDKFLIKKNLQDNKKIVNMIKTIISKDPKDPHLVVKCARTIMTLPIMVRDFNLGKQYLTKAFEMAPNDSTVLYAIENAVQAYKNIDIVKQQENNENENNNHNSKNEEEEEQSIISKPEELLQQPDEIQNNGLKHEPVENAAPKLLSYLERLPYAEGQWSITNPSGKKVYSKVFLLQLGSEAVCQKKHDVLKNWSNLIKPSSAPLFNSLGGVIPNLPRSQSASAIGLMPIYLKLKSGNSQCGSGMPIMQPDAIRNSNQGKTAQVPTAAKKATKAFKRLLEANDFIVIPKSQISSKKYACSTQAAHCLIYAENNEKLFNIYNPRASCLMQLRFDGYFGFPGGLIDAGEDFVTAVNREMAEEMNLDTTIHSVSHDDHVISHWSKKKNLALHFYKLKVNMTELVEIEKRALLASDYGNEVLGTIRIPLYTLRDHYRGFPVFLKQNFIGCSRDQLLAALSSLNILTPEEIQLALNA